MSSPKFVSVCIQAIAMANSTKPVPAYSRSLFRAFFTRGDIKTITGSSFFQGWFDDFLRDFRLGLAPSM